MIISAFSFLIRFDTAVIKSNRTFIAAVCDGWTEVFLVDNRHYSRRRFMNEEKGLLDKASVRKSAGRIRFEAFLNTFAWRMTIVFVLLVIFDFLVRYRMLVGGH
jgi:hypothetical protein